MFEVEIERLSGGTWVLKIGTEDAYFDEGLSPQDMMKLISYCGNIRDQVIQDMEDFPEDEIDKEQEELDEIEEYIKELSEKKNEILKKRQSQCSNTK